VVHIPNCSIQYPLINRVASIVRRALVDARVTSYSDNAHLGLARHLQVVVERSSQTAQVVLVANCAGPEPLAACLELIRERLGPELHSLWFNANVERGNVILGPEFHKYCGPDSVVERFGGAAVHYPPGAFGQNNLDIAEHIVAHIRAEIPAGAAVAEFHAGVGAIGLSVLDRVSQIRMNEVNPHSLRGLDLGLDALDCAARAKITVVPVRRAPHA
jgi:tRNA/tmRNA/rRNA uracil-C5-methylase (TrmA/RlmC/RlmD family)